MTRSVLLLDDQRAGRLPDRCVLSGTTTDGAVRVTAVTWSGPRWILGLPGAVGALWLRGGRHRARIAVPVSPRVWRTWRRRDRAATFAVAAGLAFVVGGIVNDAALIGLGVLIVGLAMAYRARAAHNYWFTTRLDRSRGHVTIEPTHPEFDRTARMLFDASLRRGGRSG